MTVLDSCVSMHRPGVPSVTAAVTTAIATATPDTIQISTSNFQGQHFISFDSYQKLVNIPRPANSYNYIQPGKQVTLVVFNAFLIMYYVLCIMYYVLDTFHNTLGSI